jgi:hypothetical protein
MFSPVETEINQKALQRFQFVLGEFFGIQIPERNDRIHNLIQKYLDFGFNEANHHKIENQIPSQVSKNSKVLSEDSSSSENKDHQQQEVESTTAKPSFVVAAWNLISEKLFADYKIRLFDEFFQLSVESRERTTLIDMKHAQEMKRRKEKMLEKKRKWIEREQRRQARIKNNQGGAADDNCDDEEEEEEEDSDDDDHEGNVKSKCYTATLSALDAH